MDQNKVTLLNNKDLTVHINSNNLLVFQSQENIVELYISEFQELNRNFWKHAKKIL